jgi:hypothetical protein
MSEYHIEVVFIYVYMKRDKEFYLMNIYTNDYLKFNSLYQIILSH